MAGVTRKRLPFARLSSENVTRNGLTHFEVSQVKQPPARFCCFVLGTYPQAKTNVWKACVFWEIIKVLNINIAFPPPMRFSDAWTYPNLQRYDRCSHNTPLWPPLLLSQHNTYRCTSPACPDNTPAHISRMRVQSGHAPSRATKALGFCSHHCTHMYEHHVLSNTILPTQWQVSLDHTRLWKAGQVSAATFLQPSAARSRDQQAIQCIPSQIIAWF